MVVYREQTKENPKELEESKCYKGLILKRTPATSSELRLHNKCTMALKTWSQSLDCYYCYYLLFKCNHQFLDFT